MSGRFAAPLFAVLLAATAAACSKPAPPPVPPEATIKDIMDSKVDPAGDFLFESVQQISDAKGVREKAPRTDAEWAEVRKNLQTLHDAPDYLVTPGRKAARPQDRSRNPAVENEPEQVQKLLDAQHADFVVRAQRLREAADLGLKAVEVKDKDALMRAALATDKACEGCHLHYWYPNDKRAHQAAKEEGVPE